MIRQITPQVLQELQQQGYDVLKSANTAQEHVWLPYKVDSLDDFLLKNSFFSIDESHMLVIRDILQESEA